MDDDLFEQKPENAVRYQESIYRTKTRVARRLAFLQPPDIPSVVTNPTVQGDMPQNATNSVKLPKLEVSKLDGNVQH